MRNLNYLLFFQEHNKTHRTDVIVHCTECNKSFVTPRNYKVHIKVVHGNRERNLTCQFCGKNFLDGSYVRLHEKFCQQIKEYPCETCGKKFVTRSGMHKHSLTHTDAFPHQCTVCEKRFSRADNLKTHMRIHTGEKPHICSVCGDTFRVKCILQAHESSVHGRAVDNPGGSKRKDAVKVPRRRPMQIDHKATTPNYSVTTSQESAETIN